MLIPAHIRFQINSFFVTIYRACVTGKPVARQLCNSKQTRKSLSTLLPSTRPRAFDHPRIMAGAAVPANGLVEIVPIPVSKLPAVYDPAPDAAVSTVLRVGGWRLHHVHGAAAALGRYMFGNAPSDESECLSLQPLRCGAFSAASKCVRWPGVARDAQRCLQATSSWQRNVRSCGRGPWTQEIRSCHISSLVLAWR